MRGAFPQKRRRKYGAAALSEERARGAGRDNVDSNTTSAASRESRRR